MISSDAYYGRKNDETGEFQLLRDHLWNVSKLTGEYAGQFTNPKIGEICGLLHDVGKYSKQFQRRIKGENIRVTHASSGAQVAYELYKNTGNPYYFFIAYCIAGHHRGLQDFGDQFIPSSCLHQALHDDVPEFQTKWQAEKRDVPELTKTDISLVYTNESIGFSLSLYTRFLFSCLVDADRYDAMQFDVQENSANDPSASFISLSDMQIKLDEHVNSLSSKKGKINEIREDIAAQCKKAGTAERGIFTLSVPTGGGKTLSSLLFALKHAQTHKLHRVIYSIPFTSIIEQNAGVYKDIFGEKNVLEHHSNFEIPSDNNGNKDEVDRYRFTASRWDAPLIVTTNVQLFESLFTNKPSRVRKLHNICNSVIILDEAQAIPNEYIKPCMTALSELVTNYGCSVVLCTATQPDFVKNKLINDSTEIVPNFTEIEKIMRRAECTFIGKTDNKALCEQLIQHDQFLCIVNTRRHARDLYEMLSQCDATNLFHLSTNLIPLHRKKIIAEIKEKISKNEQCFVVSTQLIEAGVDIDFPVVYRCLTGIDSIIQAAGRCNREGKRERGDVFVFVPELDNYLGFGYLKLTGSIASPIIKKHADIMSPDAISAYFKELFEIRRDELDKADILTKCKRGFDEGCKFEFETMAREFRLIEEAGTPVVIPCDDYIRSILDAANKYANSSYLRYLSTKMTLYCINVRDDLFTDMIHAGKITIVADMFAMLTDMADYDDKIGLSSDDNSEYDYVI